MATKVKTLSILILAGLFLGVLPVTWLYGADHGQEGSSTPDRVTVASIQFILVHIERETLEHLMAESDTQTLDSIPLEKIGQCVRDKKGAEIVSQTKLTVVGGCEAEMTTMETSAQQGKSVEKDQSENNQHEIEQSITVKIETLSASLVAAQFSYKWHVAEKAYNVDEKAEEEASIKQSFNLSSAILLKAGRMLLAGANWNGDTASLLLMKAEL